MDNYYTQELARLDAAISILNDVLDGLRELNKEMSDMLTIQEAENHANKLD